MQWRNSSSRFGFIAASFHWVIVAGIIAQYFLAEAAEDDKTDVSSSIAPMNLHTSLGMTLFALAVIRIVWRVIDSPPALPPGMKRSAVILANTVHSAFYVLLFAIPLSGWMHSSVEGDTLHFFGTFQIPALMSVGAESTQELLEETHELLFNAVFTLALLHTAAALKHHSVDHDNVLRRMLGGS